MSKIDWGPASDFDQPMTLYAVPAPTRCRQDSPGGGTLPQLFRSVRVDRPPVGSIRPPVSGVGASGRLPPLLPALGFCPVVLTEPVLTEAS